LIVTRQSYSSWALPDKGKDDDPETYFFNDLPEGLFEEFNHGRSRMPVAPPDVGGGSFSVKGIDLD
jgi:hypothetical protein